MIDVVGGSANRTSTAESLAAPGTVSQSRLTRWLLCVMGAAWVALPAWAEEPAAAGADPGGRAATRVLLLGQAPDNHPFGWGNRTFVLVH